MVSRGRIETGVAGGPALTRTTPRTRERTARAKDLGEQRAMTIGTTKARTLQKARINQDRAKVLEAANRSGCPKASAIREPRPGIKKRNKTCYGFNLGTCTDSNCQKGDHSCIIFRCGGDHPVGKCPLKPKKL